MHFADFGDPQAEELSKVLFLNRQALAFVFREPRLERAGPKIVSDAQRPYDSFILPRSL